MAKHRSAQQKLEKRYNRAYDTYQKALRNKSKEIEARKAIEKNGLSNIDAWEHEKLVFFDPNSIQRSIDSRNIYDGGKQHPLSTIGRGALIVLENLENAR